MVRSIDLDEVLLEPLLITYTHKGEKKAVEIEPSLEAILRNQDTMNSLNQGYDNEAVNKVLAVMAPTLPTDELKFEQKFKIITLIMKDVQRVTGIDDEIIRRFMEKSKPEREKRFFEVRGTT